MPRNRADRRSDERSGDARAPGGTWCRISTFDFPNITGSAWPRLVGCSAGLAWSGHLSRHGRPRYARRQVTAGSQSSTRVHILVITALPDELAGIKAVDDGAVGGWEERQDSAGFPYHVREFTHARGGIMRVAVARPVGMSAAPASNVATRLDVDLPVPARALSSAVRRGSRAICV